MSEISQDTGTTEEAENADSEAVGDEDIETLPMPSSAALAITSAVKTEETEGDAQSSVDELMGQLLEKDLELKRMEARVASSSRTTEIAEKELEELRRRVYEKQQTISELEGEVEESRGRVTELQSTTRELEGKLKTFKEKTQVFERKLETAQRDKKLQEQEIDELRSLVDSKQEDIVKCTQEMTKEMILKTNCLGEKVEELQVCQARVRDLEASEADRVQELADLRLKFQEIQALRDDQETKFIQEREEKDRAIDALRAELSQKDQSFLEASSALKSLRELLEGSMKDVEEQKKEKEEQREEFEGRIKALAEERDKMKAELASANDLIEVLRGQTLSDGALAQLNPAAAESARVLQSCGSLSQFFHAMVKKEEENTKLQREEIRLRHELQRTVKNLERTRPQVEKMEEAAALMRETINSLSSSLKESNEGKWEAERTLRKEREELERMRRECDAHARTATDLREQLVHFLRTHVELRGGNPDRLRALDRSAPSRSVVLYSPSQEVISSTCVVFETVEKLQETNEGLLRALRSVTDKADELELKLQKDNSEQMKMELLAAHREVEDLRSRRKFQAEMIEELKRQRDLYLSYLKGNVTVQEQMDQESVASGAPDDSTAAVVGTPGSSSLPTPPRAPSRPSPGRRTFAEFDRATLVEDKQKLQKKLDDATAKFRAQLEEARAIADKKAAQNETLYEENRRWHTCLEKEKLKLGDLKRQLEKQATELEIGKKKLTRVTQRLEEVEKLRADERRSLAELREKLSEKDVEVLRLNNRLRELTVHEGRLRRELQSLKHDQELVGTLDQKMEELRNFKAEQNDERLKQVQQVSEGLKQENSRLRRQGEEERSQLKESILSLQRDLNVWQQREAEERGTKEVLETRLTETMEMLRKARGEDVVDDFQLKLQEVEGQLTQAREEINLLTLKLAEASQSLESQKDMLGSVEEQRRAAIAAKDQEIESLKAELESVSHSKDTSMIELQRELGNYRCSQAVQSDEIAGLRATVKGLEESNAKMKEDIDQGLNKLEDVTSARVQAELALEEAGRELREKDAELSELKPQLDTLEAEKTQLKLQVAMLETAMEKAAEEQAARFAEAEQLNAELRDRLEEAAKVNRALEDQLADKWAKKRAEAAVREEEGATEEDTEVSQLKNLVEFLRLEVRRLQDQLKASAEETASGQPLEGAERMEGASPGPGGEEPSPVVSGSDHAAVLREKKTNAELRAVIEAMKREREARFGSGGDAKEGAMEEPREDLEALKEKTEVSEALVQSLQEQLKNAEKRLISSKQDADTRAKIVEDEKEALSMEVATLQQSRSSLEEENTKLKASLGQLAGDQAASAASLEMLRAEEEEHKRQAAVGAMEKKGLEAKVAQLEANLKALEENLDKERKMAAQLKALSRKLKNERDESTKKLNELEATGQQAPVGGAAAEEAAEGEEGGGGQPPGTEMELRARLRAMEEKVSSEVELRERESAKHQEQQKKARQMLEKVREKFRATEDLYKKRDEMLRTQNEDLAERLRKTEAEVEKLRSHGELPPTTSSSRPTLQAITSTSSRLTASIRPTSVQRPRPSPQNAVVRPIPSSSTTDVPHATVQPRLLARAGGTASPTRVRLPYPVSPIQVTMPSEVPHASSSTASVAPSGSGGGVSSSTPASSVPSAEAHQVCMVSPRTSTQVPNTTTTAEPQPSTSAGNAAPTRTVAPTKRPAEAPSASSSASPGPEGAEATKRRRVEEGAYDEEAEEGAESDDDVIVLGSSSDEEQELDEEAGDQEVDFLSEEDMEAEEIEMDEEEELEAEGGDYVFAEEEDEASPQEGPALEAEEGREWAEASSGVDGGYADGSEGDLLLRAAADSVVTEEEAGDEDAVDLGAEDEVAYGLEEEEDSQDGHGDASEEDIALDDEDNEASGVVVSESIPTSTSSVTMSLARRSRPATVPTSSDLEGRQHEDSNDADGYVDDGLRSAAPTSSSGRSSPAQSVPTGTSRGGTAQPVQLRRPITWGLSDSQQTAASSSTAPAPSSSAPSTGGTGTRGSLSRRGNTARRSRGGTLFKR